MRKLAFLVLLVGCAPSYLYTPTSNRAKTTKPAGCDFEVLTAVPNRPYEEIGVLDYDADDSAVARTIAKFREDVAEKVCANGGDAVIALANGGGAYLKGTVLRYIGSPPATAGAPPAPTESAAGPHGVRGDSCRRAHAGTVGGPRALLLRRVEAGYFGGCQDLSCHQSRGDQSESPI